MSRRSVAGALVVLLFAFSGGVSASGSTAITDPAEPGTAGAVRGGRTQVTPFPPPPMLCTPGSYVHSIDTHGAKLVAFTFDDGPGPWETQAIMTSFEQHGGRATFFEIGGMAQLYPDIARSVVTRGHEVGNHSQSHQRAGSVMATEIAYAQNVLTSITGVTPRVFRSPGLVQSTYVQAELARLGMCNWFGNILPGDTNLPALNSAQLCANFKKALKPGAIVMLHDNRHPYTVGAVPCMLDYATAMGYTAVTLTTLMNNGYAAL